MHDIFFGIQTIHRTSKSAVSLWLECKCFLINLCDLYFSSDPLIRCCYRQCLSGCNVHLIDFLIPFISGRCSHFFYIHSFECGIKIIADCFSLCSSCRHCHKQVFTLLISINTINCSRQWVLRIHIFFHKFNACHIQPLYTETYRSCCFAFKYTDILLRISGCQHQRSPCLSDRTI